MIEYLTVEEVIEMHDAFLKAFGGLPGIRFLQCYPFLFKE